MSRRFLTSLGALAVVALLAVPVMGQAPAPTATPGAAKAAAPAKTATSAKAKTANFTPPKTAWGDPNLQGVYNYATSTPMQRPRALGEKDVLTDDEAAELQKEKTATINTDITPRDQVGNYNDFWMDSKRKLLTEDKRTSLIVDPPNGRMPPAVPPTEAKKKETAYLREMNARFIAGFMQGLPGRRRGNRCIIRPPERGRRHPYCRPSTTTWPDLPDARLRGDLLGDDPLLRVIPDGRPHLPKNVKTWLGDPRGHWEGNTSSSKPQFPGVTMPWVTRWPHRRHMGRDDPDTYTIVERWTVWLLDSSITRSPWRTRIRGRAWYHAHSVEQDGRADLRLRVPETNYGSTTG